MEIDKAFLDNEILSIEGAMSRIRAQLSFAEGSLSTLKQLRALLDKPKEDAEPAPTE